MPTDNGVGLDDHDGIGAPDQIREWPSPKARSADRSETVGRSAEAGELLAEDEVLAGDFGTGSESGAQGREWSREEGDNGREAHAA
jgi:hypothetical protein